MQNIGVVLVSSHAQVGCSVVVQELDETPPRNTQLFNVATPKGSCVDGVGVRDTTGGTPLVATKPTPTNATGAGVVGGTPLAALTPANPNQVTGVTGETSLVAPDPVSKHADTSWWRDTVAEGCSCEPPTQIPGE